MADKKKRKSKVIPILIAVLLLIAIADAAVMGYIWYRENHIFVEDKVYPISAETLDLREDDISFDHYEQVRSQLPDCEVLWKVPFQGSRYDCTIDTIALAEASDEDITILQTYFPALKTIDASKCTDYTLAEKLKKSFPDADVNYTVSIGGKQLEPEVTELELNNGDYTMELLAENLKYLHNVKSVLLHKPEISAGGLDALKQTYPDIVFSHTVEILETEYDAATTELDLSDVTSVQVAEISEKLSMLPELARVELCKQDGTSILTPEEARTLTAAAPNAVFHYSFDFFGETLTTDAEEVHLVNKNIGDAGEPEIRLALDLMTNCKRFVLENCRVSNEIMAQLREDYRDRTKVVWRVYFGKGSSMTDAKVIRCTYDLVDDNSHDLVYCEDARFIDIGHDDFLDSVDFMSGMVNLEYAIISGAPIKDLSPLANCKKLKVLEVAFCMYLEDISPLAGCESLEMLNISQTNVKDLTPLDKLPLKVLCAMQLYRIKIPQAEQDRFVEQHPDCSALFTLGGQPYGTGWRYDGDGNKLPWYALIAQAFQYPKPINNAGWYFDENS